MKREHSTRKLCDIDNPKMISKLSTDATMCCSKCGSRSNDPSTLCSPLPLPNAGREGF